MKTISLLQPWATLVAIGAKRIETRSWATSYRGPLAIHASASKQFVNMRGKDYICGDEPFCSILRANAEKHSSTYRDLADMVARPVMPLGYVIATCELIDCIPITRYLRERISTRNKVRFDPPIMVPPDEPELSFGDYTPGRYAWILANVKPLAKPIPAKGALGLWNLEMPS
jgi:hypothetical protein